MVTGDDRPTISERYGVAVANGSTKVGARASSGDVVLAAAMQRHRLGAAMLRLQAEYDSVRAKLERAGQIRPRTIERGRKLRRQAQQHADAAQRLRGTDDFAAIDHDAAAAKLLREAAVMLKQRMPAEILSARAFVMLELTTLREASQRLGAVAVRMAARPKRDISAETALSLSGRVLDVQLDALCHHCDGTGRYSTGYAGEIERQCAKCLGTGHRRDTIGHGLRERAFAADLVAELQREISAAAAAMIGMLGPNAQSGVDAASMRELGEWLGELRGERAQSD